MRRTFIAAVWVGAIGVAAASGQADAGPDSSATPAFQLGHFAREIPDLGMPTGAAVDSDGRLFVAERATHQVCVLDATGQVVGRWGGYGDRPGELCDPAGVSIGADGTLWVADAGNHRVQAFGRDGSHTASIGERGREPGQFERPAAVVAAGDVLYVADTGNDRVQVVRHDGSVVRVIGERGSGPGTFRRPVALALDGDGRLYVADTDNHRIQRFSVAGAFEREWGQWGEHPGMFAWPSGVAWRDGQLFVTDRGNHRVQVFDADGRHLYDWGNHVIWPHEGGGKIHYPDALAIDPRGTFAAVVEGFENRLQVFERLPAGAAPPERQPAWMRTQSAHYGQRLAAVGQLLLIPEPDTQQVRVFDLRDDAPIEISKFGAYGQRPGQFGLPADVALRQRDGAWEAFVVDTANETVQTFTLAFDPAAELRFNPTLARLAQAVSFAALQERIAAPDRGRWPLRCDGLEAGRDGKWYATDARNGCVWVFDAGWGYAGKLGSHGDRAGQLRRPTAVASDASGCVYVADAERATVVVFGADGQLVREIGGRGAGDGHFSRPAGVAVDDDGRVFVADAVRNDVQIFDSTGGFVRRFGTRGLGAGEFYKPHGLGFDGRGRLVVVDWGNHRGQLFTAAGKYLEVFGPRAFVQPAREDPRVAVDDGKLTPSGRYKVSYETRPSPAPLNKMFEVDVHVAPQAGITFQVAALDVRVDAEMPEHGHGMNTRPKTVRNANGTYTTRGMLFHMPGYWQLHVDLTEKGVTERVTFDIHLE